MIIAAGAWYASGEFWTVAAPCAAAIAAAALGAWITKRNPRRLLVFTARSRQLLAEQSTALRDAGLQVMYQGNPVATPYLVSLSVLNKSRTDILRKDFEGQQPFTFDLDTPILGVFAYTVPGIPGRPSDWFRVEGSRVRIGPVLIQKGKSIGVEVLTKAAPKVAYQSNLAGIDVREDKSGHVPLARWIGVAAAIILLVASNVATGFLSHKSSPSASTQSRQFSASAPDISLINPQHGGTPQLGSISLTMTDPSTGGVSSVAYSYDGGFLATGDINGHFYIWNLAAGKISYNKYDPTSLGVYAVAFSRNGEYFATGDGNGNVYLWSQAFGLIDTLPCPPGGAVRSVAFSPDGKFLAAGDINGNVYVWSMATRQLVNTLNDPDSLGVYAVAFSNNNSYLASGDGDGNVFLWQHAQPHKLAISQNGGIRAVAFSPNDDYLAIGDGDGYAYILSITDDKIISKPAVPASDGVDAVSFSSDNTYLAVGDADGQLYLWTQISTSNPTLVLQSASSDFLETGAMTAVNFNPDGRQLAAGSSIGHLYQWSAPF